MNKTVAEMEKELAEIDQRRDVLIRSIKEVPELKAFVDTLRTEIEKGNLDAARELYNIANKKVVVPKKKAKAVPKNSAQLGLDLPKKLRTESRPVAYGRPSGLISDAEGKVEYRGASYRLPYATAKMVQDVLSARILKDGRYKGPLSAGAHTQYNDDKAGRCGSVIWEREIAEVPYTIHLGIRIEEIVRLPLPRITKGRERKGLGVPYKSLRFHLVPRPSLEDLSIYCVGFQDGNYMLITNEDAEKCAKESGVRKGVELDNAANIYPIYMSPREVEEYTCRAYAALEKILA